MTDDELKGIERAGASMPFVSSLCAEVHRLREELAFWRGPHATGGADCGCWKCCAERNAKRVEVLEQELAEVEDEVDFYRLYSNLEF